MEHRRLIESAAQEVASFGIDFIVVEPGPTATNFGAGLVHASPTDIYQGYARWCGAPVYC
jgi:NAD(P)-dependent dehydrogenase (short-subunit alcohol dehydrogenase family)